MSKTHFWFQIERAGENDLVAMTDLLQVLFTIEQDFTPQPERQYAGLKQLLKNTQHCCVLVARLSTGQIIGLCTAQLVISTVQGSYAVWIEDMIVAAHYRGSGVGKALLEAILKWAAEQGATRAQLLVDSQNTPALRFYHQLGWQETQLQARYYFMMPHSVFGSHDKQ